VLLGGVLGSLAPECLLLVRFEAADHLVDGTGGFASPLHALAGGGEPERGLDHLLAHVSIAGGAEVIGEHARGAEAERARLAGLGWW
jgi:hypothetical protein